MNVTNVVGLDFETYAAVSLPDVGLAQYINHPTFVPTLASVATHHGTQTVEFPAEDPGMVRTLLGGARMVSAHNAGFERAVLKTMGIHIPVVDSAVVAAVAGADRHLAGAAKQLLGMDKLDEDRSLLKLFATKQDGQASDEFDMDLITQNPAKWQQYREYCERDAELSRDLVLLWSGDERLFEREMLFARITLEMNEAGWPVDIASVREMRRRYEENLEMLKADFAAEVDADLNIFSHPQVKKWCADRGIGSKSFDKQNVERLISRLEALKRKGPLTPEREQVLQLLYVKRALGGSSLKKLDTILATAYKGRVYDQYVHAGAGQSLRTSGRSIQMQNLPQLSNVRYMPDLQNELTHWSNDELAGNLRQVFCAEHPHGKLVVADFASIESRALAYISGETWKTDAYSLKRDVYKEQAVKIFRLGSVDDVTKEQRTTGKVGELSCGYGAGPVAVKDFAAKMGVELTEGEAGKLVSDWRHANPNTVKFWQELGDAMFSLVNTGVGRSISAPHNISIRFVPTTTPKSLRDIAPDVMSVELQLWKDGTKLMTRVFHGCYLRGRNIGYYKPSTLKGGRPWKKMYTDPKTKRQRYYELYGGKLAGILTQSLCREIFFEALVMIKRDLRGVPNAKLIGQFHDEVVVEWSPGSVSLGQVMDILEQNMVQSGTHPSLPMGVEVKHDYRYTK